MFTDRGVYKKSSTNGPTDENPPNFNNKPGTGMGLTSVSPNKDKMNVENGPITNKK